MTNQPFVHEPDIRPLTGDERIRGLGEVTMRDFWSWAYSNCASNATRPAFVEFIVHRKLGGVVGVRDAWNAYDVALADGTRVEVKSSAYAQGWDHSSDYEPKYKVSWSRGYEGAIQAETPGFNADVYVFGVHPARVESVEDFFTEVRDALAWRFFVLPRWRLEEGIRDKFIRKLRAKVEKKLSESGQDKLRHGELRPKIRALLQQGGSVNLTLPELKELTSDCGLDRLPGAVRDAQAETPPSSYRPITLEWVVEQVAKGQRKRRAGRL